MTLKFWNLCLTDGHYKVGETSGSCQDSSSPLLSSLHPKTVSWQQRLRVKWPGGDTLATADALLSSMTLAWRSLKLSARSCSTFTCVLEIVCISRKPAAVLSPINTPITRHPCDIANSAMYAVCVGSSDSPFVRMMKICRIHMTTTTTAIIKLCPRTARTMRAAINFRSQRKRSRWNIT